MYVENVIRSCMQIAAQTYHAYQRWAYKIHIFYRIKNQHWNISTFERYFLPLPLFFSLLLPFILTPHTAYHRHLMELLLRSKIMWLILVIGENIWISQTSREKRTIFSLAKNEGAHVICYVKINREKKHSTEYYV